MLNKKEALLDDYDEEIINDGPASRGKKILFIVAPIVIVLIGIVVYGILHFTKSSKSEQKKEEETISSSVKAEYSFIEMNDIIVSLTATSAKRNFLKMSLSLQVKNKSDADIINTKLAIIKDSYQMFLRELRPSDLSGSAGVIMLKTELLKRINKIVAPQEVLDVLFKEILLS